MSIDVLRDEVLAPLGMARTTPRPSGRGARGWAVHPWADLVQAEPEHDAGTMAADDEGLALVGPWYWGTSAYGLRLRTDGELDLLGLLGAGRASRFRRRGDGTWVGLEGYHAGEVLRPVRGRDGALTALDVGTSVFTRTPYDGAAPVPGGSDPDGWHPLAP